jgi:uncharacterized RDD family membrane protein YckC
VTEKLTIETPEQVSLDYQLAGIGSRSAAIAADTVIQIVLMIVVLLLIGGMSRLQAYVGGDAGLWPVAVGVVLAFIVFYGYFAIFEIAWQGQTPGKRLLRLRVISASGRPLSAQAALLRNLVRIVDSMPGFYGIAILTVLISSRSQRLGDLAADTVVVHERKIEAETRAAGPVGAPRVGARLLRADEFALVEAFVQRRGDLPWEVRQKTAAAVADRLRRRLNLPEGGSDEELIDQVAAEYRDGRAAR